MGSISKVFSLFVIIVMAVSSLIIVKPACAQVGVTTPSMPEFSLKLLDSSYDVPSTSSTDPYTGQTVTHPASHVESRTIQVSIKNQPFTPYEITENENNWPINFLYNIRIKGHFSEDWMELYRASDSGYPIQDSESEYTVLSYTGEYSSTKGMEFETSVIMTSFPPSAQIDFQVEAMIGYIHHVDAMPFSADVFEGETSGWSSTQTLTISDNSTTANPSTSPSTSPDQSGNQSTQEIELYGVAVAVLVVFAVIAVLAIGIIFIRRKSR